MSTVDCQAKPGRRRAAQRHVPSAVPVAPELGGKLKMTMASLRFSRPDLRSVTSFAVFAASAALNIGPRGVHHHRWYLATFGADYPAGRRAIVPFLL